MIKVDDDGYITICERDGSILHRMGQADINALNSTFETRYWPYAEGTVEPKVKAAAKNAFVEAMAYYREAFDARLKDLEDRQTFLEVCTNCGGPRFSNAYCPAGKPGCDI